MDTVIPRTVNRAMTGVVQSRRRLEQAMEESILALGILREARAETPLVPGLQEYIHQLGSLLGVANDLAGWTTGSDAVDASLEGHA